jgi:hypothetical protein
LGPRTTSVPQTVRLSKANAANRTEPMSFMLKGLFHEAKMNETLDANDAAPFNQGSVAAEKGKGRRRHFIVAVTASAPASQ